MNSRSWRLADFELSSTFGVRRQSEAAAALWISFGISADLIQSGVAQSLAAALQN